MREKKQNCEIKTTNYNINKKENIYLIIMTVNI